MNYFAASNHNIPEAAFKILRALNYIDLNLVTVGVPDGESRNQSSAHAGPSGLFSTYRCNDAMISIAASARDKPVTVTIVKTHDDGSSEDILFHFDPVKKILLTARQFGDGL